MKQVAKKLFSRVALAGALTLAVWMTAAPPEAIAVPPYALVTDYYTDATFTVHLGTCYRSCNGASECDGGGQSAFYVQERDYDTCGYYSGCCIRCIPGPCPQNVLNSYPCPVCR